MLNGDKVHSWAMENKHFHFYCALWGKSCLDQGSCTSAPSIRQGLMGKNTLPTLWRVTVCWHLRGKLARGQPIMSADTSCSQVNIPITSTFYTSFMHFSWSTSHLWRRRDTCLCLAWWDPDLHHSICTLWRHKTKARRFGSQCAVKSEPSHHWDLT